MYLFFFYFIAYVWKRCNKIK